MRRSALTLRRRGATLPSMRKLLGTLVILAVLAVAGGAVYNVVADDAEVQVMAREVACTALADAKARELAAIRGDSKKTNKALAAAAECKVQLVGFSKTPLGHTYEVADEAGEKRTSVTCRRALIFFGAYACKQG